MANPAPGFEKHPDHRVDISPFEGRVTVHLGGTQIAASERALQLDESRYGPVYYLPLEDVDQTLLTPTDTDTYCPFKGHASYWSISTPEQTVEDALWAYQDPFDECAALKDHGAFYGSKVEVSVEAR